MLELESELSKQQEVNTELTAEMRDAGNAQQLETVIHDLESQLDTLKKSEKLALQKVKELEGELNNLKTLEEVGVVCDGFVYYSGVGEACSTFYGPFHGT